MSSTTSASKKTVAFFGATGGCVNAALVLALRDGHLCSALARTPKKLTDMLTAAGVPESTTTAQLEIVQGDAQDVEAVRKVLSAHGGCDMVVSGVGAVFGSKNVDWQICQKATRTLLAALEEEKKANNDNSSSKKPTLVVISTTGISEGPRDVPLLEVPMYKVLLRVPHDDKTAMERLIADAAAKGADAPFAAYTVVRPSFLLDKPEARGMAQIKVGSVDKPAVGYAITRKDVGLWIYEELVKGDAGRYRNQKPTITN